MSSGKKKINTQVLQKAEETAPKDKKALQQAIEQAAKIADYKGQIADLSSKTGQKTQDTKEEAAKEWANYEEKRRGLQDAVAKAYDDYVSIMLSIWIMLYHWSKAMGLTHTRAFEIKMETVFGFLVGKAENLFAKGAALSTLRIGIDFNNIQVDPDGVVNLEGLTPTIEGLSVDDYFSKDNETAPSVAKMKELYGVGFGFWLEANGYTLQKPANKIVHSDNPHVAITPDEFNALNAAHPLNEFLSGRFGTPLQPEPAPSPVAP